MTPNRGTLFRQALRNHHPLQVVGTINAMRLWTFLIFGRRLHRVGR